MAPNPIRRVLLTADTIGGVWTFAIELASALSQAGVDVMLATLGSAPEKWQREQARAIPRLLLVPSEFRLEWMQDPWDDVEASGEWLLKLENDFAPDAVHLNSLGHGAVPFSSPVVLTAHSCVASWWDAVKHEPLPKDWSRYRSVVQRSLQSVSRVVAPSNSMLAALRRHYGLRGDPERLTVIRNGRLPERFHSAPKEPFILSAGRLWDEGKNVAALVKAAAHVPWPVYLAGDQRSAENAQPNLAGCCSLGRLSPEELGWCYARASIYALPARYEPFGLSALEAALSGCALVLGDIDSLREIWGATALYVPSDDHDALAFMLRRLIAAPHLLADMARRSLRRALDFTPARMADAYLSVYTAAKKESYACAS